MVIVWSLTGVSYVQINWQKRKRTSTDCGMTSGRPQSAISLAGKLLRWAAITIFITQASCHNTRTLHPCCLWLTPFPHVPLRTVSHQYHLLGSQSALPRKEATSSRSVTPSEWLSEARWAAAAVAVNVCVLLVLFMSCRPFAASWFWEAVFFVS